jgi:hypothetical protein
MEAGSERDQALAGLLKALLCNPSTVEIEGAVLSLMGALSAVDAEHLADINPQVSCGKRVHTS